jgi:hypothetical protein
MDPVTGNIRRNPYNAEFTTNWVTSEYKEETKRPKLLPESPEIAEQEKTVDTSFAQDPANNGTIRSQQERRPSVPVIAPMADPALDGGGASGTVKDRRPPGLGISRPVTASDVFSSRKQVSARPSTELPSGVKPGPAAASETRDLTSSVKSKASSKFSASSSSHSLVLPTSILRRPSTSYSPQADEQRIPTDEFGRTPERPIRRDSLDLASNLISAILPPFPTTTASLESITLLSTTCMRRPTLATPGSTPEKSGSLRGLAGLSRPSTSSNLLSSFGVGSKVIWTSHQIIITSFKVNEPSPENGPHLSFSSSSRDTTEKDDPDPTRTIAHLHLFSLPLAIPGKGSPSRPGTASLFGSGGQKNRPGTSPAVALGMMGEVGKVEVDRRLITLETTAGIWDGSQDGSKEGKEKDWAGRNWVMRVGFGVEREWFCDMPST